LCEETPANKQYARKLFVDVCPRTHNNVHKFIFESSTPTMRESARFHGYTQTTPVAAAGGVCLACVDVDKGSCLRWVDSSSLAVFFQSRAMRHVSSSTRVGVSRITPSQGRAWCCGIVCWILLHVDRSQCNIVSMCGVFVH